jgi:tRNA (cytidine/uridine-2'-O-)-methyltransferase
MDLVLVHPQISQNTGNIGRLCVATGTRLHLVRPLGFSLEEKQLRRAGLDYWRHLDLQVHDSWEDYLEAARPGRLVLFTTKASSSLYAHAFAPESHLVFGAEDAGLPAAVHAHPGALRLAIPMPGEHSRSLNLSTSAGIGLYEALRQTRFTLQGTP